MNKPTWLHYPNAFPASTGNTVILCSPSGYIDINVLVTALLQNYKSQFIIEYGSGSNKKGWWLKDFALNEASSSVCWPRGAIANFKIRN